VVQVRNFKKMLFQKACCLPTIRGHQVTASAMRATTHSKTPDKHEVRILRQVVQIAHKLD
jgi:hypothetical protein